MKPKKVDSGRILYRPPRERFMKEVVPPAISIALELQKDWPAKTTEYRLYEAGLLVLVRVDGSKEQKE